MYAIGCFALQSGANQQDTPKNVATALYQVKRYLGETPCHVQTDDVIRDFLKRMLPFKLTKIEKLMILNHRYSGVKPNRSNRVALDLEKIHFSAKRDFFYQY